MAEVSWEEFSSVLEMWALYVQEPSLLMDLLRLRPDFFGAAANQLVSAGLPMSQRHELLDLYETHTLDTVERRYNELSLAGAISLDDARSLANQLRSILGYHRLRPGSSFSVEKYLKLQRAVLLQAIQGQLIELSGQEDPVYPEALRDHIRWYIADHSGLRDLEDLQTLLDEYHFFKENDFPSLRLKTLISYCKGDHNGVIAEIDALRHSISFVRKEQAADYTAILLMLVDSCYSSKLMTAAEEVAGELHKEQPENPDVLFRVLRVRKVLGAEGAPDLVLDAKLAQVENGRFMTVAEPSGANDVFLFNVPQIEIAFDPGLYAKAGDRKLLQVFVDDRIAYECYAKEIPTKVVIGPPWATIESKARVRWQMI
ncbi:MAG TPA: hypothetical protein PK919_12335 [Candidatus Aminicenantes bacterium]|nr:hypothetical protein [Candidatus Aminicenantes bacterium]